MAETSREETRKSKKMAVSTNLSLEMDGFPRDLLRGFMSSSADNGRQNSRNETCDHSTNGDDEIELNLGLSLGGRLGVDKTPGKLKRSSSIMGTMPIFREQEESEASAAVAAAQSLNCNYTAGLTRTTSLPAEMEEEWRKRKEIQTLRTREAKRRRFGKPRSCRISSSGNSDTHTTSFALEGWIATGDGGSGGDGDGGRTLSLSLLKSKNRQGSLNSCGEEGSSNFVTRCSSLPEKEKPGISETKLNETEKPGMRRCNSINGRGKETPGTMQTMPCVFTKGEGPNGKRIEGILYKYGKGKEVRIMCICHGSFLSPAEFVRHAGGGDVDHPLRHIVVNTSSASSLLL